MQLFHGSTVVVEKPVVLENLRALDFGPGFYVTSSEQQAEKWALAVQRRRRSEQAFLNRYEWKRNETSLNVLTFPQPDGEWLDFVVLNRQGHSVVEQYDVVIGPVANDTTLVVIDDYMDGRYTKEEAVRRLVPQKLTDQFAFLTTKAVAELEFLGAKSL